MIKAAVSDLVTLEKRHWYGLHTSSRLTSHFRRTREPMATDVTPERVIEALNSAGVKCVLMGTHALNTWRDEPRATQDVDVLVRKRDIPKALRAIRTTFPGLVVRDFPVVVRFVDPITDKGVLDLMKPTQTVFQLVFRQTLPVGNTHEIPNLEMALASKFAAMVSPNRRADKKMIDAGDFINVVRHNRKDLDIPKLCLLAGKVYPGGAAEIRRMIEDIDAGRTIQL